MAEAYDFLYNELTTDQRNEFWADFYEEEAAKAFPDLMDEEF